MFRRVCIWVLIASPQLAFAVDKEILVLQRDVAQLQDMVTQLQRSQDEKFAALQVLVQQSVNAANNADKAVAVIQNSMQQNIQDQQSKVVAPVVGITSRMDSLSSDFRTLQQAVSDLTSSVAKIQTQLTDVSNAIKVIQAPAPPPPGGSGGPGAGISPSGLPAMSATDMFAAAERDRNGGNTELALQDYTDYLKYYGNTAQAPAAQFYIGLIHYNQGDYETAADDFDQVLEKYPNDNSRVPEAFYFKGMSLMRIPGKKTAAADEFLQLARQFPQHEFSKKACSELQALGRRCPAPAPAKKNTRKK